MKNMIVLTVLTLSLSNLAYADNLIETAQQDGHFSTFLTAVKKSGLDTTLNAKGPITVFAPTDAAFAKIPKAKLDALMTNPTELKKVVSYHIYQNKITQADVRKGKIKSLEGEDITLSINDGVKVNNNLVQEPEINADNGVIHTINAVLMPKG